MMSIIDSESGKLILSIARGGSIYGIEWSPDGKLIACGDDDGELIIVEIAGGKIIKKIKRNE